MPGRGGGISSAHLDATRQQARVAHWTPGPETSSPRGVVGTDGRMSSPRYAALRRSLPVAAPSRVSGREWSPERYRGRRRAVSGTGEPHAYSTPIRGRFARNQFRLLIPFTRLQPQLPCGFVASCVGMRPTPEVAGSSPVAPAPRQCPQGLNLSLKLPRRGHHPRP
jgi:hypothetical protein